MPSFCQATISGWGQYPKMDAQIFLPRTKLDASRVLSQRSHFISRGMGRSYGDSANSSHVIQTSYLNHFIAFDSTTGLLSAEAGITLREILDFCIPKGWFLPVTPGTSLVTLGGAIASDVHGKNHHKDGTFGQYVQSMTLLLGNGDLVEISPRQYTDLFHATCGGMGLTGFILKAVIALMPISSAHISQTTIKATSLEETCDIFHMNHNAAYSVAWLDCLTPHLAIRSLITLGEHASKGGLQFTIPKALSIPISLPTFTLNFPLMYCFNHLYFSKSKSNSQQTIPLFNYFYPLDALHHWNRIYGKHGFIQYQFVIPNSDAARNIKEILLTISRRGFSPYLAVLKQFGPANQNILSFPIEGMSLALDFKFSPELIPLLREIDQLVLKMKGRTYLAKDAIMDEATFKAMYPNWEHFESVRSKYDAIGKFSSSQSKRIGLQ